MFWEVEEGYVEMNTRDKMCRNKIVWKIIRKVLLGSIFLLIH